MTKKQLGIALVGLGKYSTGELAPALEKTTHCKLAGIVTGSEEKAKEWKTKYRLADSGIYNYETFHNIKDNPDIDIVYVVLPNAMHAEYVIKAAEAGKHVICEKPMAVTVEDCERMIRACRDAGVQLAIGYRLHFEPHNQEAMRLGQQQVFGKVKHIKAEFGLAEVEGWRLDKRLAGGGPLMDVGIYCVQAARYTSGMEPIAVTAKEGEKHDQVKFKTVEESISWKLEFPGGLIAESNCSYAADMDLLHVDAENGWFQLSPAYEYEGIKGKSSKGPMQFPQVKEQAAHMDAIAKAILENQNVPVPGEMGKQDVKILEAIYEAARSGKRVEIK
jgi:predicted dehydrogenase